VIVKEGLMSAMSLCIAVHKIMSPEDLREVTIKCQKTGRINENVGCEMSESGCGFWKMWP
jgi:hypothetical protein